MQNDEKTYEEIEEEIEDTPITEEEKEKEEEEEEFPDEDEADKIAEESCIDKKPCACSSERTYVNITISLVAGFFMLLMALMLWGMNCRINTIETKANLLERRVTILQEQITDADEGMTDWDYVETLLESIREDVRGLKQDTSDLTEQVNKVNEQQNGCWVDVTPADTYNSGESYAENPSGWNTYENTSHGWLGIIYHPQEGPHMQGAIISEVISGSPAEAAGLKPGDIIWAIDGMYMDDAMELRRYLEQKLPGDTVTLIVEKATEHTGTSLTEMYVTLGNGDF